jgi:hypothetical protein
MNRRVDRVARLSARVRGWGLAATVALVCASGCQTLQSYGRAYQESNETIAGVPSIAELAARHEPTAAARRAALGAAQAREVERCELLRGQLAHASRAATTHVTFVWGCPVFWPVALGSALMWPLGETRTAQAVWKAAEAMERAYQTDTESFLATCREIGDGELGRAFAQALVVPTSSSTPTAPPPP